MPASSTRRVEPYVADQISPVAFDAATSGGSTLSFSHTCTGTNRYLTVQIQLASNAISATGITYNGVAMTLLQRRASTLGQSTEIWGLVNPASGANTVAITLSAGNPGSAAGAMSFTNVDQTTPLQSGSGKTSFGTATGVQSGPSQTTNTGGMIVEAVVCPSFTANAPTIRAWYDGGGDGAGILPGTGASQQTSYNFPSGNWDIASAVINAVGQVGVSGTAYTEANTAAWVMTPSATEVHGIPDAATAAYVLTTSAVEQFGKIDAATASWVMTTSAAEVDAMVDSAIAAYVLTTSATEVMADVDVATAAYVLTASASEVYTPPGAAPIALQTSGTGSVSSNSQVTSLSVPIGSGVQAGDLLVIVAGWNALAAGTTYTTPSGWTVMSSTTDSASSLIVSVGTFYKIATGSEAGTSVTVTHSATGRCAAVSAAFTSWSGTFDGSFPAFTSDAATSGGQTSEAAPSLTGLTNAADMAVLLIGSKQDTASATATTYTAPSGYTVAVQASGTSSAGNNGAAAIAYKLKTTTADETSPTFTSNQSVHWLAMSLAMKPTGGGTFAESGTAAYVLTAAAVETVDFTDSATAAFSFSPSAAEIHEIPDAATATFTFTPSTADIEAAVESATAQYVLTASAIEFRGQTYTDSATAAFVFTSSGSDIQQNADTATANYVLTPSALEVHEIPDAATATFTTTAFSAEIFGGSESGAPATVAWVMTAGGSEFQSSGNVDAATTTFTFTPSALDVEAGIDAATATFTFTTSTAEGYGVQETAIVPWVMTAGVATTDIHEIPDSATATFTFTTSFSEIFTPATGDSATAAWVMTASATVEARTSTDTATISYVQTASAATELHTISDAGTSTFTFTASGTDLWVAAETGTAAWVMTPSTTELAAGVDAATAQYVMTAITVLEVFGKIDVGTALWTMTASALEGKGLIDSAIGQFVLTAATVLEFLLADTDTAIFTFSPAAVEGGTTTDAAFCTYKIDASAVETRDSTEADTATFKFTPSAIEAKAILDFYLEAVQKHRWDASQKHHFDVIQSHHYNVAQTHRWSVVYKGRGLLSG